MWLSAPKEPELQSTGFTQKRREYLFIFIFYLSGTQHNMTNSTA